MKYKISDYNIVIADNAKKSEIKCANELSSLLEESSANKFNINKERYKKTPYISIGKTKSFLEIKDKTDFVDLKNDGFIIKTIDDNIYICGRTERATFYGVYEFLERYFGIRFLTPLETYIPHKNDNDISNIDISSVPAFEFRNHFTYGMLDDDAFYTRLRMYAPERKIGEEWGGNTDWYTQFSTIHNAFHWVDPDIYYNEHLEMFSSKDGETLEEAGHKPAQLCMTNGLTDSGEYDKTKEISTFSVALNSLKKWILSTKDTKEDFYFFGQNDYMTARCQCERCKKAVEENGGDAGVNIRFLNCLLREIRKWMQEEGNNRHIRIGTFAYEHTQNAPVKKENGKYVPVNSSVVLDKDLYIRIACYHDEYYSWFDEKQDITVRDKFETWGSLTKNLMVWTYETNFYQYLWYFPTINRVKDNLVNFKKNGVVYAMLQDNYNGYGNWQTDMNAYVYSKLLWDPEVDKDKIQDEYLRLYYKDAYEDVRFLIDSYNKLYADIAKKAENDKDGWYMFMLTSDRLYDYKCYPIDFLRTMEKRMNNSIEKVKSSSLSQNEKDNLILKLRKVRLTPLCMIAKNYEKYYGMEKRKEFCNYYIEECKACGCERASEHVELDEYRKLYNY